MSMIAKAVPGFLHISLFLFFAGLGDSLLNINTKVALSTIIFISVSGLLYIFMTFTPLIYPYQNSFSGIFWYLFQKSCGQRFMDHRIDREMKPVSMNMAQGQMQLVMEETVAYKGQDKQVIWQLIGLAEMEKILSTISGSFNIDQGIEVQMRVGKHYESEDQSPSSCSEDQ